MNGCPPERGEAPSQAARPVVLGARCERRTGTVPVEPPPHPPETSGLVSKVVPTKNELQSSVSGSVKSARSTAGWYQVDQFAPFDRRERRSFRLLRPSDRGLRSWGRVAAQPRAGRRGHREARCACRGRRLSTTAQHFGRPGMHVRRDRARHRDRTRPPSAFPRRWRGPRDRSNHGGRERFASGFGNREAFMGWPMAEMSSASLLSPSTASRVERTADGQSL
jgi:hypothetical protein